MVKFHKQLLMSGFVIFGFMASLSADGKTINTNKVYVAENGKDSYAGTFDRPFLTIHRAKEALKNVKGFKTILLKGGTHRIRKTVSIEKEDSPDLLNALSILGVGKSKVTISGEKVFKPADLKRVKWKSSTTGKTFRDRIYSLTLTNCTEEELKVMSEKTRAISDVVIDDTKLERVIAPDSTVKTIDFVKLFTDYNQYVFDKSNSKIFFTTDVKMHPFTEISVPVNAAPLIKVKATSYFRIHNISLTNNNGEGVVIENSDNFKMENCVFKNISGQKVVIDNAEVTQESGKLNFKENENNNTLVDCLVD